MKIEIPSSITKISDFAFNKCTPLIEVSIPASVTEIGRCAFPKDDHNYKN